MAANDRPAGAPPREPGDATGGESMEALVQRAAAGEPAAMDRLLDDARHVARRFGQTVCGHPEDAEDVSQEALVRAFQSLPRLREPAAFRSWLYRTVRNACLMARRRRAGEPRRLMSLDATESADAAPEDALLESAKNPEELWENVALRRQLKAALATLSPDFRAVIFLRELEGLSTRETAAALGVSEDVVKTRLHRARAALRRELERTLAGVPAGAGR